MQLTSNSSGTYYRSSHKASPRIERRKKNRGICCQSHPEQIVEGNGKKYFLHLLTPEELTKRGFTSKTARLLINAFPVYVISNEWLEQLYCPKCNCNRWYHIQKDDQNNYTATWAKRELWEQVAHVDPVRSNPSVSQYTLNQAGRSNRKRYDNKHYYD